MLPTYHSQHLNSMRNHEILYHKAINNGNKYQFNIKTIIFNECRSILCKLMNIIQPRYQFNTIITLIDSPLKSTPQFICITSITSKS